MSLYQLLDPTLSRVIRSGGIPVNRDATTFRFIDGGQRSDRPRRVVNRGTQKRQQIADEALDGPPAENTAVKQRDASLAIPLLHADDQLASQIGERLMQAFHAQRHVEQGATRKIAGQPQVSDDAGEGVSLMLVCSEQDSAQSEEILAE